MIILDSEYDPPSFVWLIGLTIVEGERREYHQFFADEKVGEEERRILMHLTEILSKKPKHQIITYGPAADMPQLENAWHRQHLSENELKELKARNLDLYTFIMRRFRLPLVSYSLKDIEEYLGFQRKDKRMDGFQALLLYGDYLRERNKAKKLALRERLLKYNKEDLDGTYHVLSHLKSLAKESVKVQSLLHPPREQFFKTYPHKGSYGAK
jgi:predicted RecB family nuclease